MDRDDGQSDIDMINQVNIQETYYHIALE